MSIDRFITLPSTCKIVDLLRTGRDVPVCAGRYTAPDTYRSINAAIRTSMRDFIEGHHVTSLTDFVLRVSPDDTVHLLEWGDAPELDGRSVRANEVGALMTVAELALLLGWKIKVTPPSLRQAP